MRWDYLPLDINPVFPCLGEIIINIIIIIIMMMMIIIIIIFSIVLALQNSKNFIFFVV